MPPSSSGLGYQVLILETGVRLPLGVFLLIIDYFLFFLFCPRAMSSSKENERFMRLAIEQAQIAEENGDVPIGAVIVYQEQIIGKAYNQRQQLQDPTAHAEIIALTQAASFMENWHLNGCTMYVTLEPCPMCAGALVLSRMDRLCYGCSDPKSGACGSLYNIVQDQRLNHRVEVISGVMEEQCRQQLQEFFGRRRKENKNNQ